MLFPFGRKEISEAVIIAGLTALVTGAVQIVINRYEKSLEKRDEEEKKKKKAKRR